MFSLPLVQHSTLHPGVKRLRNGLQLKALPGQGQHKFIIAISAEILRFRQSFLLRLQQRSIPLQISRVQQIPLESRNLPIQSTVAFYPKVVNGTITEARLMQWGEMRPFILCQGFVIPKFNMLVVQRDFARWGKQARDHLHTFKRLPQNSPAGFCEMQFKRRGFDLEVIRVSRLPLPQ